MHRLPLVLTELRINIELKLILVHHIIPLLRLYLEPTLLSIWHFRPWPPSYKGSTVLILIKWTVYRTLLGVLLLLNLCHGQKFMHCLSLDHCLFILAVVLIHHCCFPNLRYVWVWLFFEVGHLGWELEFVFAWSWLVEGSRFNCTLTGCDLVLTWGVWFFHSYIYLTHIFTFIFLWRDSLKVLFLWDHKGCIWIIIRFAPPWGSATADHKLR